MCYKITVVFTLGKKCDKSKKLKNFCFEELKLFNENKSIVDIKKCRPK